MTRTPEQLAQDFLNACAQIEITLKRRHNLGDHVHGLGQIMNDVRAKNHVVRRYWNELAAFKDLRNAIAHSRYRDGLPIATPLRLTVEAAERISAEIESPVTVGKIVAGSSVYKAEKADPLRPHLLSMLEYQYAQAPIYDGGTFAGFLTTNAVARWTAQAMDDDGAVLIDGASVADVMKLTEAHERARHIKRSMSVAEAINVLSSSKPPLALLVTENGKPGEKLLGMIVVADLPRMHDAIDVQLG